MKWESSNSKVVEVDQNEKITAKSIGTATITVSSKDDTKINATCKVTVKKQTIEAKEIIINDLNLKIGQVGRIARIWNPSNTTEKIKWTSSNESIVSVDNNGNVKGLKVGKARIQAKLNDKVYSTCTVTVKKFDTKISLDRNILMLDTDLYRFADMEAILSEEGQFKNSDIKWTVSNGNIAKFYGKDTQATGKKVRIWGLNYGDTEITATLPNGRKATCKLKVICSSKKKLSGDVYYSSYHSWVRNLNDSMNQNGWGNEYVEAYINNADKLLKDYKDTDNQGSAYQEIKKSAASKKIYTYSFNGLKINYNKQTKRIISVSQPGGIVRDREYDDRGRYRWKADADYGDGYRQFKEIIKIKPKGELSTNDWVFLFTCKNQWEYILNREEDGKWHVKASMRSSAGYWHDYMECFTNYIFLGQWDLCMQYTQQATEPRGGTRGLYWHLIHWDTNRNHGRPTSAGCIHLGKYGSKYSKDENEMYYYTMVEAGIGTRVIMY